MYLKVFEINVLEYMNLILLIFHLHPKTGTKLELLANNDMLMMVEKGSRGGICHAIYSYAKAKNRYMKNCNKSIELSYLMYLDTSNLYG